MSDGAAPLTESAPQSSTDIAAQVVESAESAQDTTPAVATSEHDPISTRTDTTNATETKTEPTQAEVSAARKFLHKLGHSETNKRGGNTYLPYGTVEKMLDKYAEEHGQTWTAEKTTLESQTKELQAHIEALRSAVSGDPKAFLSELAGIDPRYQSFLTPQQQERREQIADAANDPEPQPDYPIRDGAGNVIGMTFSLEGQKKREAWLTRQLKREFQTDLDERFKPIQEREQAEQQRAEQQRIMGEVGQRTQQQMQEAQTWPLFGKLAEDGSLTEFQQAVLDELKADSAKAKTESRRPSLSLEGAYIRVASKRMTEDDAKKRERLLKEIDAAPKSTAAGRQTTDGTAKRGPRSSADIVREVIAKSGGA